MIFTNIYTKKITPYINMNSKILDIRYEIKRYFIIDLKIILKYLQFFLTKNVKKNVFIDY